MLIQDYADYLEKKGMSQGTIKTYCGRLQRIMDRGYSEEDLKGAVEQLLVNHAKGGRDYNSKDSGNTHAALEKLKDYMRAPYVDNFFVAYEKGWSSFVPKNSDVSSYTITDGTITISYQKGYSLEKTITKKIPERYYGRLIDLFVKYKDYLSDSDTAISTVHGPGPAYRYVFGDCYGANCANLFDAEKDGLVLTKAVNEYKTWLGRFIPTR